MDWITGEKFKDLANFTFAPTLRSYDDYDNLINSFHLDKVYNGCIIYTHTFYVKKLFEILGGTTKQVYVITHNSDMNIDDSFTVPDNVIRWYAQNVNVVHPKITPIPIGLENDRWFKNVNKKQKMLDIVRKSHSTKNWLYVNHNVATNPYKRKELYPLFEGKFFATVESGKNGQEFDNYLMNIYSHKYVACPEGNGLDTHRTWETLYVGAIPVEKRNPNNTEFAKIYPMLLVDSWSDVTEDILYKKWWDLSKQYNKEKLVFEYWKNKIVNGRE